MKIYLRNTFVSAYQHDVPITQRITLSRPLYLLEHLKNRSIDSLSIKDMHYDLVELFCFINLYSEIISFIYEPEPPFSYRPRNSNCFTLNELKTRLTPH